MQPVYYMQHGGYAMQPAPQMMPSYMAWPGTMPTMMYPPQPQPPPPPHPSQVPPPPPAPKPPVPAAVAAPLPPAPPVTTIPPLAKLLNDAKAKLVLEALPDEEIKRLFIVMYDHFPVAEVGNAVKQRHAEATKAAQQEQQEQELRDKAEQEKLLQAVLIDDDDDD